MIAGGHGGHIDVIETLFNLGSRALDTPNRHGWTAIHAAAEKGHVGAVDKLVQLGSRAVDTPNKTGRTPMYIAAKHGHSAVVLSLFRAGSRALDGADNEGNMSKKPIHAAAEGGHAGVIETLTGLGFSAIDVPYHGRTPIHYAAENGHAHVIETLVRLGSRALDATDNEGITPLFLAARRGHMRAIETLVRLGSRALDTPILVGSTPLHVAAQSGYAVVVEGLLLLDSRAIDTPNIDRRTPLFAAAEKGHATVIETLVRLGSKAIDAPDSAMMKPIHVATQHGHVAVVEALVRLGSKAIDSGDFEGRTPLTIAIDAKHNEMIKALIGAGADLPRCLGTSNFSSRAATCSQLSEPSLRFVRSYDPRVKALSLKGMNLTNESAATLPLMNWRSCTAFDFRSNPLLTEIPNSLACLDPQHTTKLTFDPTTDWCSIEGLIVDQGDPQKIIEYAQHKAEGGSVPINERRLMAVGNSAVGKTTLIRRLKDEGYALPLSTDGVDMGELVIRTELGQPMRFVVWDFAGQPLYRQTHLLFLRNPGLCLLLFKLTDDADACVDQLHYWCDMLRSLTHGSSRFQSSRVLLVGTHLDRCTDRVQAQEQAEQVWRRLQVILPILEQPVLVSCADGPANKQTISELRAAILKASMNIDMRAPACIEIVRNALLPAASSSIPLLSAAAANDIIASSGRQLNHARLSSDVQLREICLRALQALGSVLLLEDRGRITHVVANPQWVALLLATVVTTRHTWVAHGRVTFDTLTSQIWRGNSRFPAETHSTLVAILEQLNIMFAVNKRHREEDISPSQVFFIPSSLPEHRSKHKFIAQKTTIRLQNDGLLPSQLRRKIKLTEPGRCIPISVLPQVLVQMMALPKTKLLEVWQQGGVFQIKQASIRSTVLIYKKSSTVIKISVQTPHPHLGSEWIRDVSTMLENQLSDLHSLNFEVSVPCNGSEDGCYLLLDDLRDCILQQQLMAPCRPSRRHASRIDLLAPDLLFADLSGFVHQWTDVDLVGQLGSGAFGKVMSGRLQHFSSSSSSSSSLSTPTRVESVAVKLLEQRSAVSNSSSASGYREFQHEAYLMSLLQHPNIVKFVGVCFPSAQPREEHEAKPALLMEMVSGGTLYESLTDAAGLAKICRLATELTDEIGLFNTRNNLHKADPVQQPLPEPLGPLHELCNGALDHLGQIFEKEVIGHAKLPAFFLDELRGLRQQLFDQLDVYYQGPVTRTLHNETEQLIHRIRAAGKEINKVVTPIEWPLRIKLATDLVQGLMYMHSQAPPLIHRDFKTPNAFLTKRLDAVDITDIDWAQPLVKVGDFGLSIRMLGTTQLKVGVKHIMSHLNPTWAAPELLHGESYSTAADVYAIGIALWELLTREHPFGDIPPQILDAHVIGGGRPLLTGLQPSNDGDESSRDEVLPEYIRVIEHCWCHSPDQRPTISEVFVQLRELARKVSPELLAALPDVALVAPTQSAEKAKKRAGLGVQYQVAKVDSAPLEQTALYLQMIDANCFWLGMSSGSVAAVHFEEQGEAQPRWSWCSDNDRHAKGVTAMCYSPSQLLSVWSASKDGRIFAWSANIESLSDAKARCYMKTKFVVVKSTLKALVKFRSHPLYCVLRNGRLHCYADEHVGAPCFEVDLCSSELTVAVQDGNLEFTSEAVQLTLQPTSLSDCEADDSPVQIWLRTIAFLRNLTANGRSLSRLAVSPQRRDYGLVTALEATDTSTWSLYPSKLEEWLLLESHHGLHNHLRLEPGRQLIFDKSLGQFTVDRLLSVCGLAWVAPNVLWLCTANSIAHIDLLPSASESVSVSLQRTISKLPFSNICVHGQDNSTCSDCTPSPPKSPPLLAQNSESRSNSGAESRSSSVCFDCSKTISWPRRRHPCKDCSAPRCRKCFTVSRLCNVCRSAGGQTEASLQEQMDSALLISGLPPISAPSTLSLLTLQWPNSPENQYEHAIQLLTLVESPVSQSGYEVWTYAHGEDIRIWETPMRRTNFSESSGARSFIPLLLDRVALSKDVPMLTCMQQVGNQVWAGTTRDCTIIGWDVATRAPLARAPQAEKAVQPTRCIAAGVAKKGQPLRVITTGDEPLLRIFTLTPEQRQQ